MEETPASLDDLPLGFSISLLKLNPSDSGLGQSSPVDPNSDTVVVHREPALNRINEEMAVTSSDDVSRYRLGENEDMAHLSDLDISDLRHLDRVDVHRKPAFNHYEEMAVTSSDNVSGYRSRENEDMAHLSDVDISDLSHLDSQSSIITYGYF